MSDTITIKIGRRGTLFVPVELRRRFGLEEGTLLLAEAHDDGILLRPAVALPIEVYSPERIAEFLLENAVGEEDYAAARAEVEALGIDPDSIPHDPPTA
jgi:AbrB family looped-hinge helix DNA binding protein